MELVDAGATRCAARIVDAVVDRIELLAVGSKSVGRARARVRPVAADEKTLASPTIQTRLRCTVVLSLAAGGARRAAPLRRRRPNLCAWCRDALAGETEEVV